MTTATAEKATSTRSRKKAAPQKAAEATAAQPKRGPKVMTDDHKAALAKGREESYAVRAYLEALGTNRPRRGRKRTLETAQEQLQKVEQDLPQADPLTRLALLQRKIDLENEVTSLSTASDMGDLEEKFIQVAKDFGERKGITWSVWREVGVDPDVLKKAGITRKAS